MLVQSEKQWFLLLSDPLLQFCCSSYVEAEAVTQHHQCCHFTVKVSGGKPQNHEDLGCSSVKQSWPSCGCWAALGLGASQIHSHAGFYQGGWEVLLILAMSESELAELPRLRLQCWTSATHPCWQPWVGSVCCPRGWVPLVMARSRAHRQHSRAEPRRPKSAKLSPFNLHTQCGAAGDK